MILQQTDTIWRENGGEVTMEDTVQDQRKDEAEEAFRGLRIVVKRGLKFHQSFGLRRNARREEGKGLVWRRGSEGRERVRRPKFKCMHTQFAVLLSHPLALVDIQID